MMNRSRKWILAALGIAAVAGLVSSVTSQAQGGNLVRSARFGGSGSTPKGGTLTYGLVGLPPTFNPFTVQSLSDQYIQYLWFPQLVQLNAASGLNECYVCASVTVNGLAITFNLRSNIK